MAKNVLQSTVLIANGGVSVAPGASIEIRNAVSGLLVPLWRDRCEQGGFLYNGWRFDSDAVSVARINGAALAAQAALSAGEPFQIDWTDADNVSRTLDAEQMLALQRALVAHADACHQLARQLKAQVEAGTITTEAEIDAAAWPTP